MTSKKQPWAKQLRQTSMSQRLVAILIIATAIAGFGLVGQGLYIKAKAVFAQVLLERAWGRALAGEAAPKAWPWADTWPVAKINLPRIKQKTIVLNNASGEAMAFGPGLVTGTPLPGRPGTSVISGHRDTHFEFLRNVRLGDTVEVTTTARKRITYKVDYMEVVDASASGIEPNAPGERLALVTCWPFDDKNPGPLRYVIYAVALSSTPPPGTTTISQPDIKPELISFTR